MVTALICNYNYGRYLATAIDSVLAQTWHPLDVLVVDDGSTDESRSVLEHYCDRIRVIFKENGGQASAFNVGIAEAQGEIICFLDSDDFWYPEKVEHTVAKYHEAPWGLICHDLQGVDETGKNIGNHTHSQTHKYSLYSGDVLGFVLDNGFKWVFAPTSGLSLPTQIAQRLLPLPEEEWRICADNPLAYAAICHAPVGVIVEPLGAYRYHGVNRFSSAISDLSSYRVYLITGPAQRYFFLNDYLERMGRNALNKEPKSSYMYYRRFCFISKERPWRYLIKLWKRNLMYHTTHKRNVIRPRFTAAWYLMLDTLLAVLILLRLPTPYRTSRSRFRQEAFRFSTRVRAYLETD